MKVVRIPDVGPSSRDSSETAIFTVRRRSMMWIPLIFFLFPALAGQAFDVDGIKSGMSQHSVKEIVSKWNLGNIMEDASHIHVSRGDRFYMFDFCDGKLTQMTKGVKPSMKTFTMMFHDLTEAYGKPLESHAEQLPVANGGEDYILDFLWRAGKEYVLLNYSVFPTNDSMHVYYHVPNRCFTYDSRFKKYFYSPK
jgi:hypothetical protein